ncbi:MAG: serine hydrolase [Elainellaceae cyanobacterium]
MRRKQPRVKNRNRRFTSKIKYAPGRSGARKRRRLAAIILLIFACVSLSFIFYKMLFTASVDSRSCKEKTGDSENCQNADVASHAGDSILPSSRDEIVYNVKEVPNFKGDRGTQEIVNEVVQLLRKEGFQTNGISISLVDFNSSSCCSYGGFLDDDLRYPASIVKLFWIAALYGQYNSGVLSETSLYNEYEYEMVHNSNNDAASRLIDIMTQTESGKNLVGDEYGAWKAKRDWVNDFFRGADYQALNITQKNFPTSSFLEPEGRDFQLREDTFGSPNRNYLTTRETARLLYEVHTEKCVSSKYSRRVKDYLRHSREEEQLQPTENSSIEGFFGQSIPSEADFFTKVGLTESSRQEAAIVDLPDGRSSYILVVFADGQEYSQDNDVFPTISRLVYDKINLKKLAKIE